MSLENTVVIKIRRSQSAGAIELQQASQLAAVDGPVDHWRSVTFDGSSGNDGVTTGGGVGSSNP